MKIISDLIEAHIFRETKKGIEFLLLKRADDQAYPRLWQMVTGKIRRGEKAFQTAIREIKEETGYIVNIVQELQIKKGFYEEHDLN